jgi:hypothetical protein
VEGGKEFWIWMSAGQIDTGLNWHGGGVEITEGRTSSVGIDEVKESCISSGVSMGLFTGAQRSILVRMELRGYCT